MNPLNDIIAAIATPIGEGGISVIRTSGPGCIEVVDQQFEGKQKLSSVGTHTAHYGRIFDSCRNLIDEVVVTVFRSPHSYTTEDSVEISCHGGMLVTRRVLDALLRAGFRLADPGEFTKRAFLNGRIDLAQAEAVADLIRARSEISHRVSMRQLEGFLSSRIASIRKKLVDSLGLLELELDFVEEGLEFLSKSDIARDMRIAISDVSDLIDSYKHGKVLREGVKVAIVGEPNVGKSSILNALLNDNRAIVTDIPGTTRDLIEESILINGILFTLRDTAGIRESPDIVEQEGVSRSFRAIADADMALIVFDSVGSTGRNQRFTKTILEKRQGSDTGVAIVFNKIDLLENGFHPPTSEIESHPVTYMSAKTGEGLDDLRRVMVRLAIGGEHLIEEKSLWVANSRHCQSLVRAREDLYLALRDLDAGRSNEFISVHLRSALDGLGEITGVVTTEEILNEIFSKFCIGK